MEAFWGFSWWWCLIPLAFIALMMIGCFFFMERRGGCDCAGANRCGAKDEPPARRPA